MSKNLKILLILLFMTFGFVNAQTRASESQLPLKRYYSYNTKRHFYTTQDNAPAGYVFEGILCYVYEDSPGSGSYPIFVLLKSNGDRLLTTSVSEKNNALSIYGYTDGGIVGYTSPPPLVCTPVYRYKNSSKPDHLYTNNLNELGGGGAGYVYEQQLCW